MVIFQHSLPDVNPYSKNTGYTCPYTYSNTFLTRKAFYDHHLMHPLYKLAIKKTNNESCSYNQICKVLNHYPYNIISSDMILRQMSNIHTQFFLVYQIRVKVT